MWKSLVLEVEGFRPRPEFLPDLQRVVAAVDPATKSHENADMTGRGCPVETMFGYDRPRGYLLHCEQDRYPPTQAMQRADCVVIEANNGGDYLPALFEQVDPTVNWPSFTRRGGSGIGRLRLRNCTSRRVCITWARRGCSRSWRSR